MYNAIEIKVIIDNTIYCIIQIKDISTIMYIKLMYYQ